MKRILVLSMIILSCAAVAFAQKAGYGPRSVEQQLIQLDKEWAAATVRRDAKAISRILAPNYTYTDFDGRLGTKEEMLSDMRADQAMALEALESSDYKIKVYGNTAVMTHLTAVSQQGSKTGSGLNLCCWLKNNF